MPRDDSIHLRRATLADAEPLARGVIEGVEDYPSFAPPGWTAPSFDAELKHRRETLADPDVCCLIAESEGALIGQITVLPAARAPHPVEDSSLAHISNLFVRRDYRGGGLAGQLQRAALETAGARSFTALRLFVTAGQARARRFDERKGWLPASDPFDDPNPRPHDDRVPLQTPKPMKDGTDAHGHHWPSLPAPRSGHQVQARLPLRRRNSTDRAAAASGLCGLDGERARANRGR